MSYEGYEVWYCKKGHKLGSWDAYNTPVWSKDIQCPVCGLIKASNVYRDCVDQTNPCFCKELEKKEKCPSHERVCMVIGWSSIKCSVCEGTGKAELPTTFSTHHCMCVGKKAACDICYGTGKFQAVSATSLSPCLNCKGTGIVYIKRYNISSLKRNAKKIKKITLKTIKHQEVL